MSPLKKASVIPVALLVAFALLPAAAGAASGRSVTVTASATVKVPNDTARIGVGVKREKTTRADALRATAAGLRKVIATAKAFPGVGEGDVQTGRINVRPVKKGEVTVYRATEGAQVTLHEPSKAGELIGKLIAAGATGVNGPSFTVGNEEEAFAKVLGAAFVKAKERAAVLAAQAGAKLGAAITIEEGEGAEFIGPRTFNGPVESESTGGAAKTAPANPPTTPGTSTVKATVHVVFELL
jgi:hypothetical protein